MEKMQRPGLGWAFVAALALTWPHAAAAEPTDTYIALGDSVAFGTGFAQSPTIDLDPSNPASISSGDRGYVTLYADFLATRDGGVRPNVINLAVNGDSTASFLGTGTGFSPTPTQNTNYLGLSPTPTQSDLFVSKVASAQAAGHTISTVSIQLVLLFPS